ncbi:MULTISPECIES: glycoside hydrolase family 3 protein [unclassified Actinomyces]|uniref:glycoside hydrolase family 3 protein n=1 Tax=unclassified Actinomyces TaxID=2609248 RepID=UPI002016AEBA|nr:MULTISPECIES: glycoside hydrolase family 3 protein [unclassified Actinomyces]MCL3778299.1 glycoside hydrolase family 3 C-terminal domain-containing protein [Actinomyces sp. AC-20-1]MCL3788761.1 glycoside hydrolase family 3 C-terminal domain-containing protein [Actinomyces sp. 187325]MCL3791629.1 glycoside hydrolase family 3 C-terminal domain-containing protein [Actinomyces sp. 186855]MCL3794292.1 glycoside hydrolase family 3 C-terminal domain-containing protein [Actinomyces sp. 217892]
MTTSEVAQGFTSADAQADRWVDPELVATARRAAAEGTVLLTNNDVLPLPPGEDVAVLGRVQIDWFAVGYGSGGDVNPPYTTNLLDSLTEAGVAVDTELADTYRAWCAAQSAPSAEWGQWPRHYEEMPLADEAITAAAQRARTAVVVIGRAAGEDRENVLEPGSYLLTDDERSLLARTTAAFERTVVVIDSGNVMDLSWAEEMGVDALLIAWPGGMEGARAVADVLTGAVEPGGRLPDTIAYSYEDYPSSAFFGGKEHNDYTEDVFVGYRYFETLAPERAQFPFGHGLGYTTFALAATAPERDGDTVRMSVSATNTGERPGSTVVQVYAAPASRAVLGVPARQLVAFARTGQVAPGGSEELDLTFPVERLASFDDSGTTGHPHAWVLEAGEHTLHVGLSVRETAPVGTVSVAVTEVLEQLEEALAPDPDHPFERWTVSYAPDGTALRTTEPAPVRTTDLRERVLARLPEPITEAPATGSTLKDVAAGTVSLDAFIASLEPEDLAELAYGDVTMSSPLGVPGNAGAFGGVRARLRERGIPAVTTTDGPSGIRVSAFASLLPCGTALASTWDPALIERMEALHAQEMRRKGSDVLLAPGMNIHRDPLCGRNFEYYSEDPLLTGACAAAYVRGVQSQGVSACPKHFAANNQETSRWVNDSRVSARALREIYLRAFRMVVAEAAPRTLMTSYNKVNGVWSYHSYDLVTTILRGEWGYEGVVITDWWVQSAQDPGFPALSDSAYRLRAQDDVLMPGALSWEHQERDDGHDQFILEAFDPQDASGEHLTLGELQRTARNVLRLVLSSPAMDRLEAQVALGLS